MGLKSSATAPTGLLSAMAPAPIDPYKYLVYRLMGRIGLDNTSIPAAVVKGLAGGILGWEDDLWFQLMLVREVAPGESSAPADRYTLNDLTNKYIGQFSVEQWTAGGQHPMRYFQILLLCGQFERAVQFLWTTAQQEVVALHFAIALAYYGVLRVPRELFAVEIDIGTYDERGQLCINFARMVQVVWCDESGARGVYACV